VLPIGILCGAVCGCEYPYGIFFLVWINEPICRLCGPNWLPNFMPLNQFWTIGILDSCSYGWSINAHATFYNTTCLTIHALMWKQKNNPWLHVLFHIMHRPLKVIWSSPNPHIHDPVFWRCTLVYPALDSLDVNMTTVLHPTHSLVLMHTQMILGNFLQSPQTHQHWCFHPLLNVPLVHNNLNANWYTNLGYIPHVTSLPWLVIDSRLEISCGWLSIIEVFVPS